MIDRYSKIVFVDNNTIISFEPNDVVFQNVTYNGDDRGYLYANSKFSSISRLTHINVR